MSLHRKLGSLSECLVQTELSVDHRNPLFPPERAELTGDPSAIECLRGACCNNFRLRPSPVFDRVLRDSLDRLPSFLNSFWF